MQGDLQAIKQDWRGFGRRRLFLWGIRWAIGFAIIAVVVYFRPEWIWLWWVGVGFAALTPLSALAAHLFIGRKLRQAEASIEGLEKALAELEEESPGKAD